MADNRAVQQAVQRALSESLSTIQRQLREMQGSFEHVKRALELAGSQVSSDRFVALLPPLMHMQAAGAALTASIEAVLRFVGGSAQWTGVPAPTYVQAPAASPVYEQASSIERTLAEAAVTPPVEEAPVREVRPAPRETLRPAAPAAPPVRMPPPATGKAAPVTLDSLPPDLQQLHKKARRFAKITVQELMLYHKEEVAKGRTNKDLYQRLKDDIDKSKILYDKRYEKIAGHNIDYLYDELVRVLAENDPSALGKYPYSPWHSRS